ncbi:hypothetical protein AYL99_00491 [Fonsecaea erecta]|uniref:Uncharacterized protein n=1 Tax=Fonsecaea erecta TaxID=1367422 RepID=A0A178ZXH5_9EURO|nr:hypothetical protein AYL99_00491 [Fonsecaea erecta]OAP64519.1 hypothetical protein AYL99_00491 [Fonsecaea erecta]
MARKEQQAEKEAEQENKTALEEPEPYSDANSEPQGEEETETETETEQPEEEDEEESAHAGQKRKEPPTHSSVSEAAIKAPRQDSSNSPRDTNDSGPSSKQLLNFLLSPSAMAYCFPADELEHAKVSSEEYKSYALTSPSSFTAFEHLLCAHMLSKPLSHKLGMRSIRTLLNEPFRLNTPEAIVSAGEKGVWEALEAARTQHRQKTASYIFRTAELYRDSESMFELAQEANDDGPTGVIEHIKSTVPGLAVTGGEIFCRRIQCVDGWGDALWPFADSKAIDAMRQIGVSVDDAEALRTTLVNQVNWDKIGNMGLQESKPTGAQLVTEHGEAQVQVAFVVALERALGCVLEGRVLQLKAAAAEA